MALPSRRWNRFDIPMWRACEAPEKVGCAGPRLSASDEAALTQDGPARSETMTTIVGTMIFIVGTMIFIIGTMILIMVVYEAIVFMTHPPLVQMRD